MKPRPFASMHEERYIQRFSVAETSRLALAIVRSQHRKERQAAVCPRQPACAASLQSPTSVVARGMQRHELDGQKWPPRQTESKQMLTGHTPQRRSDTIYCPLYAQHAMHLHRNIFAVVRCVRTWTSCAATGSKAAARSKTSTRLAASSTARTASDWRYCAQRRVASQFRSRNSCRFC